MKFYIASRLENWEKVKYVANALKDAGHKQTYDWTTHGSVQGESEERLTEVAENEKEGVATADIVVVVLPGGRGTHVELGIAIGMNKPVLICAESEEFLLLDDRTCSFYWLPNFTLVIGTTDYWLTKILKNGMDMSYHARRNRRDA